MIRCVVFRHGQTDWNKNGLILGHRDVPINETGRTQALEVKERVRKLPEPDVVFSSDLIRCAETAKIVYPNKKIIKTKLLREVDFGEYEGISCRKIRETNDFFNNVLNNKEHPLHLFSTFPNGESFAEAFQRLLNFLVQTDKKYAGKQIAVFTHGDLCGLLFEMNRLQVPEIKHGEFFRFDFDARTMIFSDFEF